MLRRELWGNLYDRYAKPGPRRLLALDGGGIRGIITLRMLARLEALLAEKTGQGVEFRLGDFFDYIAGTSTGAIIATGLARGMSVTELTDFYCASGEDMFEKRHLLRRLRSLHTAEPLKERLRGILGDDTLHPKHLRTLLLVVTRNATTDSPWPISSNPEARYNDPTRKDCNLNIPLWQLVRASTAAPVYFPPEVLNWDKDDPEKSFVFVDGGVTPYNNPAFLLYRMATQPAYRLNFPSGERNLLLVSMGTGATPAPGTSPDDPETHMLATVSGLPTAFMYAMQVDQDISCRTVGRCTHGEVIDRELGDMVPRAGDDAGSLAERLARPALPLADDLGRAFLYARYNADLSDEGLACLGISGLRAQNVRKMNDASSQNIEDLLYIGNAAGEQVELAHLGVFAE
jgi:hypothetical protein